MYRKLKVRVCFQVKQGLTGEEVQLPCSGLKFTAGGKI
jgi:hypothetical protein